MEKTVLLLGDSIRLGYQPAVAELLEGAARVAGPEDNCRFALYTLWHVHQWVGCCGKQPDVIHWNNGIWDIHTHLRDGSSVSTPTEYVRTLRRVLRELRALCPGTPIIFATTTAVNDLHPFVKNAEIDRINAAARLLMEEEGVPVNDLNAVTREDPAMICGDFLHLSEAGYRVAAKAVAAAVRPYLSLSSSGAKAQL